MPRPLIAVLALCLLLLSSCAGLGSLGQVPTPGPTSTVTPSPIGSPIPGSIPGDTEETQAPPVTG